MKTLPVSLALLMLLLLSMGTVFFYPTKPKLLAPSKPKEYMRQATLSVFTPEGTLENKLSANEWISLPHQKRSQLKNPNLTIHKSDGSTWHVIAKQAILNQPSPGKIDDIFLQENVIVHRLETASIAPLTLKSDQLQYTPSIQYAKTDQNVVLLRPGVKVTGTGLRAFLDKGSIELLHNVKTFYTQ